MANAIKITSSNSNGLDGFAYFFVGSNVDFTSSISFAFLCFDPAQTDNPPCYSPLSYTTRQFFLYPQISVPPQIDLRQRYVLKNNDNILSEAFRVVKLPLTATAAVGASNELRLTITWNFNTDLLSYGWYDQVRFFTVSPKKKLTFSIYDGNTLGNPANNPRIAGSNTWSISSSDVSPGPFHFLQFSQAAPVNGLRGYDVPTWAYFADQPKTMFMFTNNVWYDGNNAPVPRA